MPATLLLISARRRAKKNSMTPGRRRTSTWPSLGCASNAPLTPEGFQDVSEGIKALFDAPVADSNEIGIRTSFFFEVAE
jgi:hypothetical protein